MYEERRQSYVDLTGDNISMEDFMKLVSSNEKYLRVLDDDAQFMYILPELFAASNQFKRREVQDTGLPFTYASRVFQRLKFVSEELYYLDMKAKLLPSIALSVSEDENAHWTLPELHSYLIDGITVGGHTVQEEAIIIGVRDAFMALPDINSGFVSGFDVCSLHSVLMHNVLQDKKQLGCIRTRDVYLQGIESWKTLPVEQLRDAFESESKVINAISNIVERAFVAMMWLQYRQFFYDGNKRVSRFMCNAILGSQSIGMFCVPRASILEYQKLLADFYETADATSIIKYSLEHCFAYFPDSETTHWPK